MNRSGDLIPSIAKRHIRFGSPSSSSNTYIKRNDTTLEVKWWRIFATPVSIVGPGPRRRTIWFGSRRQETQRELLEEKTGGTLRLVRPDGRTGLDRTPLQLRKDKAFPERAPFKDERVLPLAIQCTKLLTQSVRSSQLTEPRSARHAH